MSRAKRQIKPPQYLNEYELEEHSQLPKIPQKVQKKSTSDQKSKSDQKPVEMEVHSQDQDANYGYSGVKGEFSVNFLNLSLKIFVTTY